MSMFTCALCDCLQDGDYVECYEWGADLVCGDCHCEHVPDNWEDWAPRRTGYTDKEFRWEITHKDYDGAPIHSFDGPADGRYFMGYSLADVWQQAMEYEDEKSLKGIRFDELYKFFRGFKTEEDARIEANKQIAFQNKFYQQDEHHE